SSSGNGASNKTRRNGKSPRASGSASSHHLITAHLMSLMQRGFTRLLCEGKQIDLSTPDDYQRENFDGVYVLVDRLMARPEVRQRLVDSFETCFREGHGQAVVEFSLPSPVGRGVRGEGHSAENPSPNPFPEGE